VARDKKLWSDIKADFLATNLTLNEIAKKYHISISTLKKTAATEHWTQEREAIIHETKRPRPPKKRNQKKEPTTELVPITSVDIIEAKRERLDKFMEITDMMMDRILSAMTSSEVISAYSLKMLASALRDLREMQGLNKSELDIEEQMARIAKIRSETKTVDVDVSNQILVEFIDLEGAEN